MGVRSASEVAPAVEDFDAFYAREYAAMVALAYVLSGSRWAAEDLAQEAFLAAHREWERIGAYDRPGAWVRQVVMNKAASAVRRRIVETKALARIAFGRTPDVDDMPQESADFWHAVRELPKRQGQVVALHYLEDLSVAQIAAIIGTAEGTVKKHLHDARQTLAHRLGVEEEEGA